MYTGISCYLHPCHVIITAVIVYVVSVGVCVYLDSEPVSNSSHRRRITATVGLVVHAAGEMLCKCF
jgi:hypothetical protein